VRGVEEVKSADLRHRIGECVARAARGETFVVIRYSEPIALLRPRQLGDEFESFRVTEFWRDFPRVLAKARNEGALITWYSDAVAVLAPLPEGWRRGEAA
jgi:antitoxin (DNA-binding transcriptional repressor) of toxin-antitoxin stability system